MPPARRKRERPESAAIVPEKPPSLPPLVTRRTSLQTTPASKELNNSHTLPPLEKNEPKSGDKMEATATQTKATRSKASPVAKQGSIKNLKQQPNKGSNQQSGTTGESMEPLTSPHEGSSAPVQADESQPSEPSENSPQHDQVSVIEGEDANPSRPLERREDRIKTVLSHRRTLLSRIRLCKSSIQSRLDQLTEVSKVSSSGANGKSVDTSTVDEVVEFREMTRQANQAAKQQRAELLEAQHSTEKRTSVSLRRGASVGKRMNAALSTLAPGGGSSAVVADVGDVPLQQSAASILSVDALKSNAKTTIPPRNSSGTIPSQALPPMTIKSTQYNPALPMAAPVAAAIQAQEIIQRKKTSSSLKGMKQIMQARGNTMASGILPHPLSQSAHTLPKPPSVVCPQAVAMRERRNLICEKLTVLYLERAKKLEKMVEEPCIPSDGSLNPPQTTSLEQHRDSSSLPNATALLQGPSQPSMLPRRRKAQWDYVLEEMRWLSSDFVEERKWKLSSARIISSAVVANALSVSQAKELERQKVQAESSAQAMYIDSDEKKEDEPPVKEKKSAKKKQQEPPKNLVAKVHRTYVDPTSTDLEASRVAAQNLSSLIRGAWEMVTDSESLIRSAELTISNQQLNSGDLIKLEQSTEDNAASERCLATENELTVPKSAAEKNETLPDMIEVSNESISDTVKSLVEQLERKANQRSRRPKKAPRYLANMSTSQLKVVDFAEFIWSIADNPGAMFQCSERNETEVIRALFCSPEHQGPRLVLCPAVRQFEWRNELFHIDGRRVLIFGASGLLANAHSQGRQGDILMADTDIVIADLSLLNKVAAALDLDTFVTIVVDARATRRASSGDKDRTVPQLVSVSWWSSLLNKIQSTSTNRVLMTSGFDQVAQGRANDLSEAQRLRFNILCAQVAFVIGPNCFRSSEKGILRRVLSWAKHESKAESGGKKPNPEAVETKLTKLVGLFCVSCKQEKQVSSYEVEVRRCQLSDRQKLAYDDCCRQIRAALSFKREGCSKDSGNRNVAAASAIEQLRRVCFHADLASLYSDFSCASSSQTNIDASQRILDGSAKLRELIVFLKEDCGIKIQGGNVLRHGKLADDVKAKDTDHKQEFSTQNVTILCSSPEGQLLTSRLLSLLGIEHDTLATTFDGRDGLGVQQSYRATLAWIQSQRALSKFAYHHYTRQKCKLLVLSPISAGTVPFAHGLSASDVVVCLDEDWSGRSYATFHEIVNCCAERRLRLKEKRGIVRIIRFVCKNTLEETIAYGTPKCDCSDNEEFVVESENDNTTTWPRDAHGSFVLDASKIKGATLNSLAISESTGFSFPAMSLLRITHNSLNDVLLASESNPTGFLSSKTSSFLPFQELAKSQQTVPTKLSSLWDFVRELLAMEERMSPTSVHPANRLTPDRRCIPVIIVPPKERAFTADILSWPDTPFLAGLLYMSDFSDHFSACQASNSSFSRDSPRKSLSTSVSSDGMSSLRSHAELADSLHAGERAPGAIATSLLVYIKNDSRMADIPVSTEHTTTGNITGQYSSPSAMKSTMDMKRLNSFAASYSRMKLEGKAKSSIGGNFESRVYFPPLFPGILLSSKRAQHDLSTLQSTRQVTKRKGSPEEILSGLQKFKRVKPCAEDDQPVELESLQVVPQVATVEEVVVNTQDAASRTETKHSVVPDANIVALSVVSEDESTSNDPALFLLEMNEDYGLLGVGATASVTFSGYEAASTAINLSQVSNWSTQDDTSFDYLEPFSALNAEDSESSSRKGLGNQSLLSMLLFVPRKNSSTTGGPAGIPGPHAGQFLVAQGGAQPPTTIYQYSAAIAMSTGTNADSRNGAALIRKPKHANAVVAGGASAFSLLPLPETVARLPNQIVPTVMGGKSAKEIYRSKAQGIVGTRQYGFSLFDAPGFRLASVRIRDRVHYRMLSSLTGRPDFLANKGAGLDSQCSTPKWSFSPKTNEWISIAKRRKLHESSTNQSASHRDESPWHTPPSAMVVPASVDFGPFQTGHCDDPTQQVIDSLALATKNGVSLPMGVKTSAYKLEQHAMTWPAPEDSLLHSLVKRYPANWYLVARGFGNPINSVQGFATRSPRQCKERWELLTKNRTAWASGREQEANQLRCFAEARREAEANCSGVLSVCSSAQPKTFLLPPTSQDEQTFMVIPAPTEENMSHVTPRRTFLAFRGAIVKRQSHPMTIPGVVAGQKPTLVASHPSHHQSLQAALASTSAGQAEMWPLQILDMADKLRIAAAPPPPAPTVRPSSSGNKPRPAYPTPPRPSRPPSSGNGVAVPSSVAHPAPPTSK